MPRFDQPVDRVLITGAIEAPNDRPDFAARVYSVTNADEQTSFFGIAFDTRPSAEKATVSLDTRPQDSLEAARDIVVSRLREAGCSVVNEVEVTAA
ncbi:MAG TPA: hypothetical protein VIT68_02565 [Candidatus Gracilibacteria bacterium]